MSSCSLNNGSNMSWMRTNVTPFFTGARSLLLGSYTWRSRGSFWWIIFISSINIWSMIYARALIWLICQYSCKFINQSPSSVPKHLLNVFYQMFHQRMMYLALFNLLPIFTNVLENIDYYTENFTFKLIRMQSSFHHRIWS